MVEGSDQPFQSQAFPDSRKPLRGNKGETEEGWNGKAEWVAFRTAYERYRQHVENDVDRCLIEIEKRKNEQDQRRQQDSNIVSAYCFFLLPEFTPDEKQQEKKKHQTDAPTGTAIPETNSIGKFFDVVSGNYWKMCGDQTPLEELG